MKLEKYQELTKFIKNKFSKEIKETQKKLDNSNTNEYDLWLVSVLWDKIMKSGINEEWPGYNELIFDEAENPEELHNPMPESVHKQFMNMLVKTKNINLLTDIDIYEDLLDIEACTFDSSIEKEESELKKKSDAKGHIR